MIKLMLMWLLMAITDNENSWLDELLRGDFYDAIVGPYVQTLGPVFHVIIFVLGPTLVGIKYQRLAPAAMIILVSGVVFAKFFETPIQFLFAVAAIFGLAGVLYSVVHK